jgi:hypothetical protein
METVRLRGEDPDSEYMEILARDGKGRKTATRFFLTLSPSRCAVAPSARKVKLLREKDLREGHGEVYINTKRAALI